MTSPGNTASGTFAWSPALSDLIIAAYGRCQIRRNQLTVEHLQDAAMAANLLQLEWANEQVNLWTVELISTPLIAGQNTYDVDPTTIMIMATYVTTGEQDITVDNSNIDADEWREPTVDAISWVNQQDRILTSMDRDSYASFPKKLDQDMPTVYWFNKQVGPSITLWPVPDAHRKYVLHYYRARHLQDAVLGDGALADVPRHFLEAYVAALAAKCAELYAPALTNDLIVRAGVKFKNAADRDVEDAPLRIVPALDAYTRAVY
jgi:hypothetical protein